MRSPLPLLALLMVVGACSAPADERDVPTPLPFRNANTDVAFVGDAACFDCHEDQYAGYQSHGMANSLYAWTPETAVERTPGPALLHDPTGLTYRAYREGDRLLQEEYLLSSSGVRVHHLVREVAYVVGSGTAARTYLAESNGRLYEMPLTWYTQDGRWDFSPGYRTQKLRFDRLIPARCMACHNSYPEAVPHVEGKYAAVPEGIGCERCHGPGALHVEARLESPDPPDSIDLTIVNPAHLALDRRLDVCQQCHLHGEVSILRAGRSAFDFRPSQSLDAYLALYSPPPDREDQISVISHADRMKQSACFVGSREGENPMDCTTCHDPHQGFRELGAEFFNRKCLDCHGVDRVASTVADAYKTVHRESDDCYSCHMPKVDAEDAPHASFTDHFIRVVHEQVSPPPVQPGPAHALAPYFRRDASNEEPSIYTGIAYIVQGRQVGAVEQVEHGIDVLREALETEPDSTGEGHYNLGVALEKLGRVSEAVAPLEVSVRRDPGIPERLNALALAYEATGASAQQVERLYERALQIQPALADVRVNYGRFLEGQGFGQRAQEQYQLAAHEQPWLAVAHYNLGTAYQRAGRSLEAESELKRAVQLEPSYAEARGNLALLYLQQGKAEMAEMQFELAVERSPEHPVALANLGAYYLNHGRLERAATLLEKAVEIAPDYTNALVNLALAYVNLDRPNEALEAAQQALARDPDNQTAKQVLAAVR